MRHGICLFTAGTLFATYTWAAQIDQTITLTNGWNAVYVSVSPQVSTDELFAGWPVWSVAVYNADAYRYTASASGGKTGEPSVRSPYWTWSRESPEATSLRSLQGDSVLVCFSTNTEPFTAVLRGSPKPPRIAWHVANDENNAPYNVAGVRLSGRVKARDYFAGCPALANAQFYFLSGLDEANPRFRPVATGAKTAYLNNGDVVFMPGSCISDWSGPLYITPRDAIDFGEEGLLNEVTVRNDGVAEKTVEISYADSINLAARPQLLYKENKSDDATATWAPLTKTLVRVLATGETWRVALALDRSSLSGSGAAIGGILNISEVGGTMMSSSLSVSARDVRSSSPWPQGLWCADIQLSKVSFYISDFNKVDDIVSGGVMPVKVYVHVDKNGIVRLLQRVVVAGLKDNSGKLTQAIYGPNAALPVSSYSTRLSSAVLPVDLPETAGAGGRFGHAGETVVFNYVIRADSPSNPFRHALHPMFDGKKSDFKSPAPDGDDFSNYTGNVKPELFSIGGEIRFSFGDGGASAWTPKEEIKGECTWIYTGVRRDGPIAAKGSLKLRRIAKIPEINLD